MTPFVQLNRIRDCLCPHIFGYAGHICCVLTYQADINFEQMKVNIEDKMLVPVTLPKIEIMDIIVDLDSLDYIFYGNKAN